MYPKLIFVVWWYVWWYVWCIPGWLFDVLTTNDDDTSRNNGNVSKIDIPNGWCNKWVYPLYS